jgi:hypothetical protein
MQTTISLLLRFTACSCLVQQVAYAQGVKVEIGLQSAEIRVFDPLLLAVTIENSTAQEVVLPLTPSTVTGIVALEAKKPEKSEFYPVHTLFGGTLSPSPASKGFTLAPKAKIICYEMLFMHKGVAILDEPGEWEYRAIVNITSKARVYSPVAKLIVKEREPKEREFISTHHATMAKLLNTYSLKFVPDDMSSLDTGVSKSNLRVICDVMKTVYRIRQALTRRDLQSAVADLQATKEALDPLAVKAIDRFVVESLIAAGHKHEAKTILLEYRHEGDIMWNRLMRRIEPSN